MKTEANILIVTLISTLLFSAATRHVFRTATLEIHVELPN